MSFDIQGLLEEWPGRGGRGGGKEKGQEGSLGFQVDNLLGWAFKSPTLKPYPKGPCTQIVYTLGPMYLHREYFKAKVYILYEYMDP